MLKTQGNGHRKSGAYIDMDIEPVQHHTMLHCTRLHYTAINYTTPYNTTLHYTTPNYTTSHHLTLKCPITSR